jgi:AcrR family transcriptional regulator
VTRVARKTAPTSSSNDTVVKEKTKDVLLRVAIAEIERVGEAHVRLEDVLREANASVSSLYHHYGNIRSLIDEAQMARFDSETGQNIQRFRDAVLRTRDKDDFARLIDATVRDLYSRERRRNRSRVVNAFGSIFENPNFQDRLVALQNANADVLVEAFVNAQVRGFVREDLDLRGFAIWCLGLTYSRAVPDMLGDDAAIDAWIDMTITAVNGLLGL